MASAMSEQVCAQEKTCTQCGRTQPLDSFNRSSAAKDGRRYECRECQRCSRIRDYEKERASNHRYRRRNRPRVRAHELVYEAIKRGELVRPTVCSGCGEGGRIEAHHDDYSKPLDVRWLCPRCHKARHAEGEEQWATSTERAKTP